MWHNSPTPVSVISLWSSVGGGSFSPPPLPTARFLLSWVNTHSSCSKVHSPGGGRSFSARKQQVLSCWGSFNECIFQGSLQTHTNVWLSSGHAPHREVIQLPALPPKPSSCLWLESGLHPGSAIEAENNQNTRSKSTGTLWESNFLWLVNLFVWMRL